MNKVNKNNNTQDIQKKEKTKCNSQIKNIFSDGSETLNKESFLTSFINLINRLENKNNILKKK